MRPLRTTCLTLLACLLPALPAAASQEQQPVSQQLLNALTLADNCLYMLDSNAGNDPADCQALLRWHAEQWPVLQQRLETDTESLPLSKRDLANRQAYEQTVAQIRQWFENKGGF